MKVPVEIVMDKITGITGAAFVALDHLVSGGEYTTSQFAVIRDKATGQYFTRISGETAAGILDAELFSMEELNRAPLDLGTKVCEQVTVSRV
jgi:hypothetical protein